MRRFTLAAALITVIAISVQVTASAQVGNGDIAGRVLDKTCPGPCQPGGDPRPFAGEAVVRVRSVPDHELVTTMPVVKSRFKAELAPGRYGFHVVPYPDQPKPKCWQGSVKRASVEAGKTTHLRLTVQNICVV
jgi:hypothetical protein